MKLNKLKLIKAEWMMYHTCSAISPMSRAASVGLLARLYSSTASNHLLLDASDAAYRVNKPSTCWWGEYNGVGEVRIWVRGKEYME